MALKPLIVDPSIQVGYARNAFESARPDLWAGLVGAWAPALGPTGGILRDVSLRRGNGTLQEMEPNLDWALVPGNERVRGYSLNFGGFGTNDRVSFGALSYLNFQNDFTIVAWVNPVNLLQTRSIISRTAESSWVSGGKVYQLNASTGVQRIDANPVGGVLSNTGVAPGVWSHVAVTHDNDANNVSFFLNGVADGGGSLNLPADNAADPVRLAIREGPNGQAYQGPMAMVLFYNRILAAKEITDLYDDFFALFRPRRRQRRIVTLSLEQIDRHYPRGVLRGAGRGIA